jgi:hypothetical protein
MIFNPKTNEWRFELPRGASKFCDHWGPWRGEFSEVDRVSKEMATWEQTMERVGWFRVKLSKDALEDRSFTKADLALMDEMTSKLPRCSLIPYYWLQSADRALAAKGKAATAKLLRIGGQDLCIDTAFDWWGPRVGSMAELSLRAPGEKRYAPGTRQMDLDAASLDTLIEFLVGVRGTLVTSDADQSIHSDSADQATGQNVKERFRQRVQRSDAISNLFKDLQGATLEQIRTLHAMSQMMRTKEMEIELIYAQEEIVEAGSVH